MKYLVAVLLGLGLAGCNDNQGPLSPDFGNATAHNMAAQVIHPEPLVGAPESDTNGQRMSDAVERYRKNKVIQPIQAITSNISIGGGAAAPATPATPGQ